LPEAAEPATDPGGRGALTPSRVDVARKKCKVTKRDISYQWLTWGVMKVPGGGLSDEVLARIDADRRRAAGFTEVSRTIPLVWAEDRSIAARFISHARRLRQDWRRLAELTFNGDPLCVEALGGVGGGPGFIFTDVRIYLRDELVGRAWWGGCSLGFSGRVGPAVAVLGNNLALRVNNEMTAIEVVLSDGPDLGEATRPRESFRAGKEPAVSAATRPGPS